MMGSIVQVSHTLYRSPQPTRAGFRAARAMGIRTVANLRWLHTDLCTIQGMGFHYYHWLAKPWHPELEDFLPFLRVVLEPDRQPVLVHCQHGQDRTGVACALYRMVIEGWPANPAIQEMADVGWHRIWSWLPGWLGRLDPMKLYARAIELPLPREAIW